MDEVFTAVADRHGFITRSDVFSIGLDDRYIRRQLRSRAWHRVRNGAYSPTPFWAGLDPAGRHRVLTRATLRSLGDGYALSHQTGLLFHPGCEVWGVDLSRVHLTRRSTGTGGIEAGVVQHTGVCHDSDLVEVDGLPVMNAARCVVETSLHCPVEAGVVCADSALRHKAACMPELDEARGPVTRWKGGRRADLVLRLADGRAESVGESRARYLCWSQGLPMPELQFLVRDPFSHQVLGICDFCWPERRLLGEFDGRKKYGRLLTPDDDPEEVVFREKQREDALRMATGFAMWRLTWSGLYEPQLSARRARMLMSAAA